MINAVLLTRELAVQDQENSALDAVRYQVRSVYGGSSIEKQIRKLMKSGTHIVVGTPGRLLNLIKHQALGNSIMMKP